MKVVLYSALYGNYEAPKPLPDLGIPAIMYTDNPDLEAPGWQVILASDPSVKGDALSAMMAAKYWKCHPAEAVEKAGEPYADVSLWVDASMTILVDDYVQRCLDALGTDDWTLVQHPARTCIYDEAEFSALLSPKYDIAGLSAQAEYYRSIGHPARWGLFANGANVRRHTPAVMKVCEQWWWECTGRSWQDQVSLPVLIRLAGEELKWNTGMPWGEWWSVGWH